MHNQNTLSCRSRLRETGFSLLDLLIALFVLVVILLIAVQQFGAYRKFEEPPKQPAAAEQAAETQAPTPPQ